MLTRKSTENKAKRRKEDRKVLLRPSFPLSREPLLQKRLEPLWQGLRCSLGCVCVLHHLPGLEAGYKEGCS